MQPLNNFSDNKLQEGSYLMAASSFCCLKATQNCLNQTSKYAMFLCVKFPHDCLPLYLQTY